MTVTPKGGAPRGACDRGHGGARQDHQKPVLKTQRGNAHIWGTREETSLGGSERASPRGASPVGGGLPARHPLAATALPPPALPWVPSIS